MNDDTPPVDGEADGIYGILLSDSLEGLPGTAADKVIVSGGHAGLRGVALALAGGARALIAHDAGCASALGAVLEFATLHGLAMAIAGEGSCRPGDAADMLQAGRICRVNPLALTLGIRPGVRVEDAAERLLLSPVPTARPAVPPLHRAVRTPPDARRPLVIVDDWPALTADDAGAVVVCGAPAVTSLLQAGPEPFAVLLHDGGLGPAGLHGLEGFPWPVAMIGGQDHAPGAAEDLLARGHLSAVNRRAGLFDLATGMDAVAAAARLCGN